MMDNAPNHAVRFHLPKLLNQHLLGNRRYGALKLGKSENLAAEQMEEDQELPSSFEDLECLFNIVRGSYGRVFIALTLG